MISIVNPLDHLRLLWWILVMPQQLKNYRAIYGEQDQKRVGKWLVSTLIWLPLLIPTLGLGLELLPSRALSADAYLLISVGLAVSWLLTGLLGGIDYDVHYVTFFVTLLATFFGMFNVTRGMMIGVSSGMAIVVMIGVAIGVANSVAIGVANSVKNDVNDVKNEKIEVMIQVAIGVMFGVGGFFVIAVVSVMMNNAARVAVKIVEIVLVLVGLGMFFYMENLVKKSLKTSTPSWLARFAFLLLVVAHIGLIWFCFLGGWRLFV